MDEDQISLEEAAREVELVSKRLALLHLSYAETLTEELGEEKGKELVLKAIKNYGKEIGDSRRKEIEEKGLDPTAENFSKGDALRIPRFGMHSKLDEDEDGKMELYGCALGKFWKERGQEDLGKLYCYVDPAKYMGYNEDLIQVHDKALSAGDKCCKFTVRPSTEKEKEIFRSEGKDFSDIDESLK